jgi:hypothetical protein
VSSDHNIHVTYSSQYSSPKDEGGDVSEGFKSTDVLANLSIQNKHRYKIGELYIRDKIPVPSDKRCGVLLQRPKGLVEDDGDEECR